MNGKPSRSADAYGPVENCWHKSAQINRPSPSQAAVFIDEHEKSMSQAGFWINNTNYWAPLGPVYGWLSFPATRHSFGATVSFADGHAERWQWRENRTRQISAMPGWIILKPSTASDRDLLQVWSAVPYAVPIR